MHKRHASEIKGMMDKAASVQPNGGGMAPSNGPAAGAAQTMGGPGAQMAKGSEP